MNGIFVLAQTVSEDIKSRRSSPIAHDVDSLILAEVLARHVEEVLLLPGFKRDVVLPKLALDLAILLVGLLLHVIQTLLLHILLYVTNLTRRGQHCLRLTCIGCFARFCIL